MGAGRGRDRCSERMPERRWRVLGRGRGAVRDRGGRRRAGSARRQRPRWTRRCGGGSCSVRRRSTRCGTSVPTIATTSTSNDGAGKSWEHLVSELYAVGWRVRGRPRQWVWSTFPSLGTGGSRGAGLCGVRRRRPVAGLRHAGGRRRRRLGRGGPGPPAGRGADASTGLMPEQKLEVPACPRRENGHLWRFDRERSTRDCQADVCQALQAGAADVVPDGAGGALRGSG